MEPLRPESALGNKTKSVKPSTFFNTTWRPLVETQFHVNHSILFNCLYMAVNLATKQFLGLRRDRRLFEAPKHRIGCSVLKNLQSLLESRVLYASGPYISSATRPALTNNYLKDFPDLARLLFQLSFRLSSGPTFVRIAGAIVGEQATDRRRQRSTMFDGTWELCSDGQTL